jgi:23S rRNA (uracil1939-C5)-methyltransferase
MRPPKKQSAVVSHPGRKNINVARMEYPLPEKRSSGAKEAAEKGGMGSEFPEKHPSGAKALIDFAAFTARLKSCPVTKPGFSAACKASVDFAGIMQGLKPPPPSESQLVEIEKPVYGGGFLARIESKAVFVPLVLPGERARVRIAQSKSSYAIAEAEEIVASAPERVSPACPHFGVCGGCHYQHADYEAQLAFKQAILRETLERGGVPVPAEIAMLSADPWRYRNRIRLAFDAAGRPGYRRRSHGLISVSECPIAAPLLLKAAEAFAGVARKTSPAFKPAEIALFCNSDETSLLATVSTASAKKIRFDELALAWHECLPALIGADLLLEGRNGEPPRTVAQWGAGSLTYRAADFDYRVDRGAFFQVNRWLVNALVERVIGSKQESLRGALAWDLYAGVGLFARRLTANFTRVVAVESAPSATQALAANLKGSRGIPIRSATVDFLHRNCKSEQPDLIVVDPPRTGLGAETCALLAKVGAPAVACVSCDPATLARDLRMLIGSGYAIQSITLADLFPQTFHIETVVQLRRS